MTRKEQKQIILDRIKGGEHPQILADEYGIPYGTIRSWLSRCNKSDNATKKTRNKNATKKRNNATGKNKASDFTDKSDKNGTARHGGAKTNSTGGYRGGGKPFNINADKTGEFTKLYFSDLTPRQLELLEAARQASEIERLQSIIYDLIHRELVIKERITAILGTKAQTVIESDRRLFVAFYGNDENEPRTTKEKLQANEPDEHEINTINTDNRLIALINALNNVQNQRARHEKDLYKMKLDEGLYSEEESEVRIVLERVSNGAGDNTGQSDDTEI